MIKKILSLFLIFSTLISFSSCYSKDYPKNKKNVITEISNSKCVNQLTYNNTQYFRAYEEFLHYTYEKDYYILLSWTSRWPFENFSYGTYTEDNPIVITESCEKALFFREDYDYTLDTYILEKTYDHYFLNDNIEFSISDFISNPQYVDRISIPLVIYNNYNSNSKQCLYLNAKECPLIYAEFNIYKGSDNYWYVWNPSQTWYSQLSDNAVKKLMDNNIIQ